jgi:hypothetical protein
LALVPSGQPNCQPDADKTHLVKFLGAIAVVQ